MAIFILKLMMKLPVSFKVYSYADSLLILVQGETRHELETLGEQTMLIVQTWSDRFYVKVANGKISLLLLKDRTRLSDCG